MSIADIWADADVVAQHVAGAEHELLDPLACEPYSVFIGWLEEVDGRRGRLLDIGCGAGAYGMLCARYAPAVEYYGIDRSPGMIAVAKELCPTGHFFEGALHDVDVSLFDVVLISACIEFAIGPITELAHLLNRLKPGAVLLLHRARPSAVGEGYHAPEDCYGRQSGWYWWDMHEVREVALQCGCTVSFIRWDRPDIVTVEFTKTQGD